MSKGALLGGLALFLGILWFRKRDDDGGAMAKGGGKSKAKIDPETQRRYAELYKAFPYKGDAGRSKWKKDGKDVEFVRTIAAAVRRVAPEFGLKPDGTDAFVTAHAALSSGWGRSVATQMAKNTFGIKADPTWDGPVVETDAFEHKADASNARYATRAAWRMYPSFDDNIRDHLRLVTQVKRYARAGEKLRALDLDYMAELGRGGWYTSHDGSVPRNWKAILKTVQGILGKPAPAAPSKGLLV